MAGPSGTGGGQQRQALALVAVVVGCGIVLTVGALVFRSRDSSSSATPATSSTTATTASTVAQTSPPTDVPTGPAGITYNDPNKIYRMTLGPNWTEGPNGYSNSPTWLAPVPGGTAQVNPLLSRAAGPDSLTQFVQSTITRMDSGPLYRTTTTEPTTLADGTPATIVHFGSSTGAQLAGRALVTVHGPWGMTMLVQCPPEGADACFAALDPYIRSVTFL